MTTDIFAYGVIYYKDGLSTKALFLDKVKADEYAAKWHGVVVPLIPYLSYDGEEVA